MAILKLKLAGEEATLAISTAEVVQGQYGEQVKFSVDNGDVLYVPLDSVRRQIDRCGVGEIDELSGRTLHFSRAAGKNGVVFWNIDKARPDDVRTPKSNGNGHTNGALLPYETSDEGEYETGGPPPTPAKAAPRAIPAPTPEAATEDKFAALCEKYDECAKHIVTVIVPAMRKNDIPVDCQGVFAGIATLLIARRQEKI